MNYLIKNNYITGTVIEDNVEIVANWINGYPIGNITAKYETKHPCIDKAEYFGAFLEEGSTGYGIIKYNKSYRFEGYVTKRNNRYIPFGKGIFYIFNYQCDSNREYMLGTRISEEKCRYSYECDWDDFTLIGKIKYKEYNTSNQALLEIKNVKIFNLILLLNEVLFDGKIYNDDNSYFIGKIGMKSGRIQPVSGHTFLNGLKVNTYIPKNFKHYTLPANPDSILPFGPYDTVGLPYCGTSYESIGVINAVSE